jgi:hypothetical protein
MVADYHAIPRKMKPTVGLTRFCCLMNLCEKTRVWTNENAGFSRFKNSVFFERLKKTIFPTRKRRRFSALINTGLQPGVRGAQTRSAVLSAYRS